MAPVDLYASGNRAGPRPPRPGDDFLPDAGGMIGPESPPLPVGASTFADPLQAPLTGHYHRIERETPLPAGFGVVADGADVHPDSPHPPTHHTLYPARAMPAGLFVRLFPGASLDVGGEKVMSPTSSISLWDRVVQEFIRGEGPHPAREEFFGPEVDRVGLVRRALQLPGGANRMAAVALLKRMPAAEQQQLFPELTRLARSAHGPVGAVREVLLSLPRPWVLERIDAEVEPVLREYDDFWMVLELYQRLDPARCMRLARRAAGHPDAAVRELGEEWLERLQAGTPENEKRTG